MGLRRSVIHGILLGFPFFAVYIYRTMNEQIPKNIQTFL